MIDCAEDLFERLKNAPESHPLCRYSLERCRHLLPTINRIQVLKKQKNAIILAHTYVHPDIVYGVADFVGDSYSLSRSALATSADTIVFPAVRFMAETAKILNPAKTVIDPNPNGGCSLSDSIDADDVYRLRAQYPRHTFVCYINTSAAVKAACDVCVTSSNVYRIMENIESDKIYFLPDRLMGENVRRRLLERGIKKEILLYDGTCYVHEEIEPDTIDEIRKLHSNAIVIAHPECKPEVVEKADCVGSTTDMQRYVLETKEEGRPYFLLSECGVATRVATEIPGVKLVGGCTLCKYMRSNSLDAIVQALENPQANQIIEIEPEIQKRALQTVERMFTYAK